MFTFKNMVAIGLFLFGTTFLWMTRDFLAEPKAGTGTLWSVVQGLVLIDRSDSLLSGGPSSRTRPGGSRWRWPRR